ncbi:MAG: four helix bundle protein [Pseudomonadota bacterium]
MVKDFRQLDVWQKSHQLALVLYRATAGFPMEERFGLRAQIRRAAVSVPANISEGCGRHSDAEFARFCIVASGSASELEYHLLLARELRLLPPLQHEQLTARVTEIKRMLTGLVQTLAEGRSGD